MSASTRAAQAILDHLAPGSALTRPVEYLAELIQREYAGLVAAANELIKEYDNPLPDFTMRGVLRKRLRAALKAVRE